MGMPWETLLRQCERRIQGSAIRDLLAVTAQPDVISFAGGLPAADYFPVEDFRVAMDHVLRTDGAGAMQYGPTEGHFPLRAFLAEWLKRRGINTVPEEILITTGSQQALDLLGKVLLPAGSRVLVESPSYVGALQAFTQREPRYVPAPMDDQGLQVEYIAALPHTYLAAPSLLYTVASFQNPSGVTMSLARREQLLALSAERALPLVEDDPYGELRYEGEDVPPLRALPGGEETIYLGTFSKILAPGLRIGWIVAPRPVIAKLVLAKQAADLHSDSLAQRAILYHCTHADMIGHIERLRTVYRTRRDAMLAALARYFPQDAHWTHPDGGLFLWVTLSPALDTTALLREAVGHRVAFVPGSAFFTDGSGHNTLRLSFSHASPELIEEGVRRLAGVLAMHLEPVSDLRRAVAQVG